MKTILVVSTDNFEAQPIVDTLQQLNYTVLSVEASDTHILDQLSIHKPDLVILRLTENNAEVAIMIQENFHVPIMHIGSNYATEQLTGIIEKILSYLPAFSILTVPILNRLM